MGAGETRSRNRRDSEPERLGAGETRSRRARASTWPFRRRDALRTGALSQPFAAATGPGPGGPEPAAPGFRRPQSDNHRTRHARAAPRPGAKPGEGARGTGWARWQHYPVGARRHGVGGRCAGGAPPARRRHCGGHGKAVTAVTAASSSEFGSGPPPRP